MQKETEASENLERKKLAEEINNLRKSTFKTMAFWGPLLTFLTAAFVYLYLFSNGTFDKKQAHIQWVTDTLTDRAKYLNALITKQKDSFDLLHKQLSDKSGELIAVKSEIQKLKGSPTDSLRRILELTAQLRNSNTHAEVNKETSDTLRSIIDSLVMAANYFEAVSSSARKALFYNNTEERQKDRELINYFQRLGDPLSKLNNVLLRAENYRSYRVKKNG
jgi:septal ring factor EnvC (AmiA/AmiB activator)